MSLLLANTEYYLKWYAFDLCFLCSRGLSEFNRNSFHSDHSYITAIQDLICPMKALCSLLIVSLFFSLLSCKPSPQFSYEDFDYADFGFYNLPMGHLPVGFQSELHWDHSRAFNGLDKRPVLMGLWYPAELTGSSRQLAYKDYLLADSEHDGVQISDTTANRVSESYIIGAKNFFGVAEADAKRVMNLPVRAFGEAKVKVGKFPLLLYAASFNAGIHENAAICEYLASHGYVVASIASVGSELPGMSADSAGIAAQLADFRILYDEVIARDYIDSDKFATAGFSWGGFPTTLMGIEKKAKLMISMDGSHTYFPQAVAQFQDTYDRPAHGAYLQLGQRMSPNAQFNQDTMVYHWIGQKADAYLYRFKAMDHRDFGGAFQYLHAVADDSVFRAGQTQFHTKVYSKHEKGQGYLKTAEMMLQALNAYLKGNENDKVGLNNQPDSLFSINRRLLGQ